MDKNYTPLDTKKFSTPKQSGTHSKIDVILIGIIVITMIVLGAMLTMLFLKSS